MLASEGGRPDLEGGGRLFLEVVTRHGRRPDPVVPALAPDLVVYEQYDLGAAVAAHRAGIPAVCHALSPVFAPEALARSRRSPPGPDVGDGGHHRPSFDVFTGDVYLDIFPTCLQQPSFLAHPARVRSARSRSSSRERFCPTGSVAPIDRSST